MGFGNDTVNTVTVAPGSKVLPPMAAAVLPTFINFSGVINTGFTGGRFTDPAVQAGNQLATLDRTALADGKSELVTLYAITGLDFSPSYVWLDQKREMFASGGVWQSVVREGWEAAMPDLVKAQQDAVHQRAREQAERAGIAAADYFCGIAQTGELTLEGLKKFLKSLPEGATELMCHPGYVDAALKKTATRLQDSRRKELEILMDTGIRNLVASQGIRLIDYGFVIQEA